MNMNDRIEEAFRSVKKNKNGKHSIYSLFKYVRQYDRGITYDSFVLLVKRVIRDKKRDEIGPVTYYYIPSPRQQFTPMGELMGRLIVGDEVILTAKTKTKLNGEVLCEVSSIYNEGLGEIPLSSLCSLETAPKKRRVMAKRLEMAGCKELAEEIRNWGDLG